MLAYKSADRSFLKGESIDLFRAALRNPNTRDPYERRLIWFLKSIEMKPDDFVNLAKTNPLCAEKKIIATLIKQSTRVEDGQLAAGTVDNITKPVRLLLEMNDISLNWRKMRRVIPPVRRYALDRVPTAEEIRKIVDSADLRGKALILTLLSSGIREGAIEGLRVRDYSYIRYDEKLIAGRLIIYNGDPERYSTFISPEACESIDVYLEFRRIHGEKVGSESPLFRDKFDPIRGRYGHDKDVATTNIIPMTAHAVRQYYNRLMHSIGIRNEKKRRHEFSVHGFRKYFKTKCETGGMKPINIEILMGHSTGISDSYYRPTETELLDDYKKVVDLLTINESDKLRAEFKNIEALNNREQLNTDAITALSDQVMRLTIELERMKNNHQEIVFPSS